MTADPFEPPDSEYYVTDAEEAYQCGLAEDRMLADPREARQRGLGDDLGPWPGWPPWSTSGKETGP